MPLPSETALKARARALLQAMTERERWIYAIPEGAAPTVRAVALAGGFRVDEDDAAAKVVRFADDLGARLVVFESAELDVLFVEASGAGAAAVLADLLDKTGFFAQSQLLRTALDVQDPETSKALRTLAHMIVAWDEDWSDLFLLHLASPDPVARHEAAVALTLAAMVARDAGPAVGLLEEAQRRETFPKLRDTLAEAIKTIGAMSGAPVDLSRPDS